MGLKKGANVEEIRAKYILMGSLFLSDNISGPEISANNERVNIFHLNSVQAEHAIIFHS
jgi:hypothetical protein